jgi:CTP:molybdopterin cytidylyltransferase MocA
MPDAGGFDAIVLAGDRSAADPLLDAAGVPCKAVLEFAGRPMVLRVLDCLGEARQVRAVTLSGPRSGQYDAVPELVSRIESGAVAWLPPEATPSTSAAAALARIPAERPVLLTTADHPLLRPAIVDEFCQGAQARQLDVAVGLAPYRVVREAFPELRKTVLRFRDEHYCGCNLFAFLTPRGRELAARWREVEAERKNPRKLIAMLGLRPLLAYRLGMLRLDEALQMLSRRLGMRIGVVPLHHADAAVDVDTAEDRTLLEARYRARA